VLLVSNDVGAQGPRLAVLTGRQLVVDMGPVTGCTAESAEWGITSTT